VNGLEGLVHTTGLAGGFDCGLFAPGPPLPRQAGPAWSNARLAAKREPAGLL